MVQSSPLHVFSQGGKSVLAHTAKGITEITIVPNPITLVDGADVTITTTTTSVDHPEKVDAGRISIQIATDGAGNPVASTDNVNWVTLVPTGKKKPSAGITSYAADLQSLNGGTIVCSLGTTVGFRAQYVTGGGKHEVGTHTAPTTLR
ncbi:MAG: hypothetical protein U0586_12085 [Candidatus Brocadiaceae bacterium]